jgi:hypothetical protein
MHLITQPVHVLLCSNSAMKGNNGTNRIPQCCYPTATELPPRVSQLEPGFLGCSLNINCSCCRKQHEGRVIWPHHVCVSSCQMSRLLAVTPLFTYLFNNQRFSNLQPYCGCWTCETYIRRFLWKQDSRWMFSSVTCAAVLWFFKTILPNVRWSLSVNVDFRPLFLIADVVFLRFVYANITLETVVRDTPNIVAVLSRCFSWMHTNDLSSSKIGQVSHFLIRLHRLSLSTIMNALRRALQTINKRKNIQCYQQKLFQCSQHTNFVPQFLSVSVILFTPLYMCVCRCNL